MNYLHDKKPKRKKFFWAAIFIVVSLSLFYFKDGILGSFSRAAHFVFRPILVLGAGVGEKFSSTAVFFKSQKSLLAENESLRGELEIANTRLLNYNSVLDENIKVREILGRKKEGASLVLSAILGKPGRSPYDVLIIDAGAKHGIGAGNLVFALGSVPVGRVAEVYSESSKVVLFSSPGEKTEVLVSGRDVLMEALGRGGGNFEMTLSRDLTLEKGTAIILPGIDSRLLGTVETTISDPRDAFNKVLLVSPVNVQELKFVEVKI